MEIRINGKIADIIIENEKTVGEVMSNLELWLSASGHRLSAVAIDGQTIDISSIEEAFSRDISSIKTLDFCTASITELTLVCLMNLIGDLDEFDSLDFNKRNEFFLEWLKRPQAVFAGEQMPDLFSAYRLLFENSGVTSDVLRAITEERINETEAPVNEFIAMRTQVEEICRRLVDLPLDIQTGKDGQAAVTIQLFSAIAEKTFRLYRQFEIQGYFQPVETLSGIIDDFNVAIKELLQAYEMQDTVLIGDLAEYEMAPRLLELYNTIYHFIKEQDVNDDKVV